jgi:hypothetical protein
MDENRPRRFQFGLRPLLLAFLPVAIVALPLGYVLRRSTLMLPVPASGTVTLDGTPLRGAIVTFHPTLETGYEAWGKSDPRGRFTLKSWIRKTDKPKPGALPAFYRITIEKREAIEPARWAGTGELIDAEVFHGAVMTKLVTPVQYADANKSGLTANVTIAGPNVFVFSLVSAPQN